MRSANLPGASVPNLCAIPTVCAGPLVKPASASANVKRLGLADRCEEAWWDAQEGPPEGRFDLVLINPPFHTGKAVDLAPAHAMFHVASQILAPGGLALVVTNRTLPYERELSSLGTLRVVCRKGGYKVLELTP